MKKNLTLLQLYPQDMNIYGDWGNTLALARRAEQHGYTTSIVEYNQRDTFPDTVDIILGGGGQDSGQKRIIDDLHLIAPTLRTLADSGTPMLMICGLYQLFGRYFITSSGERLAGIDILPIYTQAGDTRHIGNIHVKSEQFGDIIGYENHSGNTFLDQAATPLGTTTLGVGNNLDSTTEGCIHNAVVGSYLHGSLLPKNPAISDYMIATAAKKRFGSFTPTQIDDSYIENARQQAYTRPR